MPLTRIATFVSLAVLTAVPAYGNEIWIVPTHQQDVGGLGVGSNAIWPVSPAGVARLAVAVPDDLKVFQNAKVVLIPQATTAGGTLNLYVCRAAGSQMVTAACAGPIAHPFSSVANQLLEIDVSAALGPHVGTPGQNHLAVVAYTTPSTATDRILGMRFAYDPVLPAGAATLGPNTFTGIQSAPAFVGNGAGLTNLPFPAGAATLAANTFTGTQRIDDGNLDLDTSSASTGNIRKGGVLFIHDRLEGTFVGLNAGASVVGGPGGNTGIGSSALQSNTSGFSNTAIGAHALIQIATGRNNLAVGVGAGSSLTDGSNNIYIDNFGTAVESQTIRIGRGQQRAFILGIRGVTTGQSNAVPVVVDSAGQLGTVSSSRRYKEDVHDMDDASGRLLQLRPVTFRYTQAFADGAKPVQYGLIAEEVADVFPELVVRDDEGRPETVQYQNLSVLLLNELQKLSRDHRAQQARIDALERELAALRQDRRQ